MTWPDILLIASLTILVASLIHDDDDDDEPPDWPNTTPADLFIRRFGAIA